MRRSTEGPSTVVSPSKLHTKLDKERLRSLKVVNHDENVVHPVKRHIFPSFPRFTADAPYLPHVAYHGVRLRGRGGVWILLGSRKNSTPENCLKMATSPHRQ